VRVGEHRPLRRVHEVAEQREGAPQPDGGAVDLRDDRLLYREHLVGDPPVGALALGDLDRVAGDGDEPLEVAACAERAARTLQDDDIGARVGVDVRPDPGEFVMKLGVDRVARLRPVDGDGRDPVGRLDLQGRIAAEVHLRSLATVTAARLKATIDSTF
jgi:hypothetical protein